MAKLKQEQLHELNMRRETWCCVEVKGRIWDRPERRHFACQHRNTCDFSAILTVKPEERSSWMTSQASYREKRHVNESYESHFM
ncbi:spermatogenesis-associated protein 45-like [Neoarius graeffei]|uniref:spermatogenesis-associated protein 45-like n=1 Tax=Neoarius graeffei TaxID=443677 RepID=UPI00298D100D|nr:spermatogenesis-associated protein 45-like [Neoarius graeffei]